LSDRPEPVIALFDAVVPAEFAARRLRGWMSSNPLAELETMAILTKAGNGRLALRKLGPRETRKGSIIGVVAGAVAATTSGALSLFDGLAAGAAGGAAVGSFFRKKVRLSHHTCSRIARLLSPDGAAVVVVVPTRHTAAVIERLVEYGGRPDDAATVLAPAGASPAEPAPAPV
jgi:uncharacterized membrane protein